MKRSARFVAGLCFAGLVMLPVPTQAGEDELRKEIDQLKIQVKALQQDLDQIKATLRDQNTRANPVFDTNGSPSMGDAAAKLVLIEFSDFECPYCAEYVKTAYLQLLDAYVKTGKIRYVFADYPGEKIHPHSLKAAEAGRCAADQGKFWPMHDQLFLRQRDLATTAIADAAQTAGLNRAVFDACLAAGKYTGKIREAEQATATLGVQGTPAFFFGTPDAANPSKVKLLRALVGAQTYSAFQQTIDGLLSK